MKNQPTPYARNFILLLLLESFLALGTWTAHPMTVLPQFLLKLGASTTVVGLLPSLWALGQGVGSLAMGFFTAHLKKLNVFLGIWHMVSFTAFLGMGLLGLWAASTTLPAWLGTAVAIALLVFFNLLMGSLFQLYFVMLSRVMPEDKRANLFGVLFAGSTVVSLFAPFLAGHFISQENSRMQDFAYVFFLALGLFIAGTVAFFFLKERRVAPQPRRTLGQNMRILRQLWGQEPLFRRYLYGRMWLIGVALLPGFLATYARAEAGWGEHSVTLLGLVMLGSEAVAALALGWLASAMAGIGSNRVRVADHQSASLVPEPTELRLRGFTLAQCLTQTLLMGVLAFAALGPGAWAAYAVAAAAGLLIASELVVNPNVLLEMGQESRRGDFMALASIVAMPVAVVIPPLAGALIGVFGHRSVFGLAALAGVEGLRRLWGMGREMGK